MFWRKRDEKRLQYIKVRAAVPSFWYMNHACYWYDRSQECIQISYKYQHIYVRRFTACRVSDVWGEGLRLLTLKGTWQNWRQLWKSCRWYSLWTFIICTLKVLHALNFHVDEQLCYVLWCGKLWTWQWMCLNFRILTWSLTVFVQRSSGRHLWRTETDI